MPPTRSRSRPSRPDRLQRANPVQQVGVECLPQHLVVGPGTDTARHLFLEVVGDGARDREEDRTGHGSSAMVTDLRRPSEG